MFDPKWIRENRETFDKGLARRGLEPQSAAILALDDERRELVTKVQEAQTRRNAASKEIGKAKAKGDDKRAQELIDEVAALKSALAKGEDAVRAVEAELFELLAGLPNIPLDDVPDGEDENDNQLIRQWGEKPEFDFKPKEHFEIGEALGLMDFEIAAKLSGSRFVVLKGALARLERALAAFMLDLHTSEFGYQEMLPPALVRDHTMFGTGQLPKFHNDQFVAFTEPSLEAQFLESLQQNQEFLLGYVEERGLEAARNLQQREISLVPNPSRLWLIPTAEVPLTNMVRESVLDETDLPLRVTAWTPCFRAEAGAAGKDTRGMIRQHQFSKVELVSITTPEAALDEHERMTACAEEVLKRLGLAYQVVALCTGDLGFSARKTYDLEVWLPGQDRYREISSCSVCGDFQARRMGARYRPQAAKDLRYVHTLNGSGLAVGRCMVAILETYQEKDGSVRVPEALLPYMGGTTRIAPPAIAAPAPAKPARAARPKKKAKAG